jgi:hypothetical protein
LLAISCWVTAEEGVVRDGERVLTAGLAGACIGALLGYLYLTAGGRRLRDQIEPRLDEALREVARLRQAITKAQAVAAEGWRSLNQVAGVNPRAEWGTPRQSAPH